MKLKKQTIVALTSFLFILTGCQTGNTEDSETSNTNENTQTSTTRQRQTGRGAESDGQDTNADADPTRILTEDADAIVIYFSRGGNTEDLANMIQQESNADILELTVADPYPANYEETVERANQERETENYPELSVEIPDLSQYQTIYLGSPTWGMSLSSPVTTFLQENGGALSGKTIAFFNTNAGYGVGSSEDQLAELVPDANLRASLSMEDVEVPDSQSAVEAWVNQ
ncbi:flavodoxin family protein [Enterococcus alishanensis]